MRGCRKIQELPEEILTDILIRLPVKYILRCMSVQKSWYYLVKTPMFVNLHLNHIKFATHDHHSRYLFFENAVNNNNLTICYDDIHCREYCTLRNLPPLINRPFWYAQSNGLICLSIVNCEFPCIIAWETCIYPRETYLYNPLVQKYRSLPASPIPYGGVWCALAFGFVPEVNDYVVVHLVKNRYSSRSVMICVYSLNTNSWKSISRDDVSIHKINVNQSVFVNGSAFWIGQNSEWDKIVMCFDTKTDMLREIWLPLPLDVGKYDDDVKHIIHPYGQSIAYFLEDQICCGIGMWVLKDCLMNEYSWEKKASIYLTHEVKVGVSGVRNNGELILERSDKLISYNLDNHVASDLAVYDEVVPNLGICPFVESLVLLNTD